MTKTDDFSERMQQIQKEQLDLARKMYGAKKWRLAVGTESGIESLYLIADDRMHCIYTPDNKRFPNSWFVYFHGLCLGQFETRDEVLADAEKIAGHKLEVK